MKFKSIAFRMFLFTAAMFPVLSAAAPVRVCIQAFREELTSLALLSAVEHKLFEKHGLDVDIRVPAILKVKESVPRWMSYDPDSETISQRERVITGSDKFNLSTGDRGVTKSINQGECEFGTTNIESFVTADLQKVGRQTQPLLLSSYDKGYDVHLVTSTKSNIYKLQDLKGKRVRLGQMPNRIALDRIMKKQGMSLSDIHQMYGASPLQALAGLDNGEVDAVITYVPTMPYMLASGRVRVVQANVMTNAGISPLPHSLIIGNRKFVEDNPEITRKFLAAVFEAVDGFRRNPGEVITVYARNSTKLGDQEWKVDDAIAERSGAFIGQIHLDNLYESPTARVAANENIRVYFARLAEAGYVKSSNDLSAWLGVSETKPRGFMDTLRSLASSSIRLLSVF